MRFLPPRREGAVKRVAGGRTGASRLAAALLAAVLVPLCAACAGRAEENDPIVARVQRATHDEKAQRAIAALLSSCGGYEVWQQMREAEYRYRFQFYGGDPQPRLVRLQQHWLSLDDEVHVRLQDVEGADPIEVRLDRDQVALLRGGQPFDEPSQAEFQRAFGRQVRWDFLVPWTFLQSGILLESRGVRTPPTAGKVPSGPCDVVRVRFERPMEGGGTDDWHDVYISGRSHLVEEILTYHSAANQYRLSVWSDQRDFDGLRVATRRETYASDEGAAVGQLEAVAEYSDVRFIRRDAGEAAPSAAR
jgi:hypothetical protein